MKPARIGLEPGVAAPLERDLSLVLPRLRRAGGCAVCGWIGGRPVEVGDAVAEAARHLGDAAAPAILGPGHLSIEAVREAVALAESLRGRLLPCMAADPVLARLAVVQTATLGHVWASDLVLWVGGRPRHCPIAASIASRPIRSIEVGGDLATVLELRLARAPARGGHGLAADLERARRVAAILAPPADVRVLEQWHRLAAERQCSTRLSVLGLPDPRQSPNAAGAAAVVAWQTGLTLGPGGVDFADGAPRPCPATLRPGTCDVLLDAAGHGPAGVRRRIAIGTEPQPHADVAFQVPGLALGLAARVMRLDGVVLWLCEQPAVAPADPTARLLAALGRAVDPQR